MFMRSRIAAPVLAVLLATACGGGAVLAKSAEPSTPLGRLLATFARAGSMKAYEGVAGLRWYAAETNGDGGWRRVTDVKLTNRKLGDDTVTLNGPKGGGATLLYLSQPGARGDYKAILARELGPGVKVKYMAGKCPTAEDGRGGDAAATQFFRIDLPDAEPVWIKATHETFPNNPTGNNLFTATREDFAPLIFKMKCTYAADAVAAG